MLQESSEEVKKINNKIEEHLKNTANSGDPSKLSADDAQETDVDKPASSSTQKPDHERGYLNPAALNFEFTVKHQRKCDK